LSGSNTNAGGWTGATYGERGRSLGVGGAPYGVGGASKGVNALATGIGAGGVVLFQSIGESVRTCESGPKIGDELSKLVSGAYIGAACGNEKWSDCDVTGGLKKGRFSRGEGGDGRTGSPNESRLS
jgi:hypothetical protein